MESNHEYENRIIVQNRTAHLLRCPYDNIKIAEASPIAEGNFHGLAGASVKDTEQMHFGHSDIVIKDRKNRRAVVLEAKRTYDEDKLESDCEEALAQPHR